jgi:hypothetical protein
MKQQKCLLTQSSHIFNGFVGKIVYKFWNNFILTHQILPEWYALMHECQSSQQSMDESTVTCTTKREQSLEKSEAIQHRIADDNDNNGRTNQQRRSSHDIGTGLPATPPPQMSNMSTTSSTQHCIRLVRQSANQRLREWANANIRIEHRAAVKKRIIQFSFLYYRILYFSDCAKSTSSPSSSHLFRYRTGRSLPTYSRINRIEQAETGNRCRH